MNSAWAIAHERWVDASYWLSEDPLYRIEAAVARVLIPSDAATELKLYAVEVFGSLLWAAIALLLFLWLSQTVFARRLDETMVSVPQVLLLFMTSIAASYGGALVRERLPDDLQISDWWFATVFMLLAVVISGMVPVALISFFLRRRRGGS
jgi:hypothetical protein